MIASVPLVDLISVRGDKSVPIPRKDGFVAGNLSPDLILDGLSQEEIVVPFQVEYVLPQGPDSGEDVQKGPVPGQKGRMIAEPDFEEIS